MVETLTLDNLMVAVRSLKPAKRHRIIVGFPLVEPDEVVCRDADGLVLMGHAAYGSLLHLAKCETVVAVESVTTFTGIPIEHYDANYGDHWELFRKLATVLYDLHLCSCGDLCTPDEMHGCRKLAMRSPTRQETESHG